MAFLYILAGNMCIIYTMKREERRRDMSFCHRSHAIWYFCITGGKKWGFYPCHGGLMDRNGKSWGFFGGGGGEGVGGCVDVRRSFVIRKRGF